jgi:hypothetical protein
MSLVPKVPETLGLKCAVAGESCMFTADLAAAGESGHDPAAAMARLMALDGATTQSPGRTSVMSLCCHRSGWGRACAG